jgi:hypothetical protein
MAIKTPRKRRLKAPTLRLVSGDMSCAICRLKILIFDKKARRDETFTLLGDGRSVHSRCLRNDPLDEHEPSKRRTQRALKANGILAAKRAASASTG